MKENMHANEVGFRVILLGPGRRVSSLIGHSRCVILCRWHKKVRPGTTLHEGGGRMGFLDQTGLYQSVIAGVPPTTSAYNAAAQSTYPDNIGLWVRGQALRNTQRTLCAGDVLVNGSGLMPLGQWMQSIKSTHNTA